MIECTKEGGQVNMYHSWNIRSGQPGKPRKANKRLVSLVRIVYHVHKNEYYIVHFC